MTKREAAARFIYGSNEMNNRVEYDNDYPIEVSTDGNHFCNNDCYSCEVVCPYKEY